MEEVRTPLGRSQNQRLEVILAPYEQGIELGECRGVVPTESYGVVLYFRGDEGLE